MMQPLNYPPAPLKLTRNDGKLFVWDEFRKRKVLLTPEEWVRQHVLHYLISSKGYPSGLIASEHGIKVNQMVRRCDGVVFDKQGTPLLLLECKAPGVKLTEKIVHQVAQYNFELKVNWLVMTNGLDTIVAFVNSEKQRIDFVPEIPTFQEMNLT